MLLLIITSEASSRWTWWELNPRILAFRIDTRHAHYLLCYQRTLRMWPTLFIKPISSPLFWCVDDAEFLLTHLQCMHMSPFSFTGSHTGVFTRHLYVVVLVIVLCLLARYLTSEASCRCRCRCRSF